MWITIIVIIVNVYRYYHNGDGGYNNFNEDTDNNIKETVMEEVISTRQLALNTIEKIDSEPKYDENGRIQFEYQGVIFLMEAVNDCMFVNLVHIKKHFLFVEQIPDLEGYLKLTMDSFFRTARTLDIEVEKCRLQECER